MKNNSNNKDEIFVKYDKNKFDTKLKITDKIIYLEKKKGILKKEYKVVASIKIDDIKTLKDEVLVKDVNNYIEIETINNIYKIECDNSKTASKLVSEIKKIKTGEDLIGKTTKNLAKIKNVTIKTIVTAGTIATVINKNKDEIMEAIRTIKSFIKK